MNRDIIVLFDCGDTLVDESSQVFDEEGVVLRAELIPGTRDMLLRLHDEGYRMALVADGGKKSFHNILRYQSIEHLFDALIISEEVKAEKPDSRMFHAAMKRLNLHESDKKRIVMIGNNLERDIAGANRLGICSILLSFSPRYRMHPIRAEETPDYVVSMPCEIPDLLSQLDLQVKNHRILKLHVIKEVSG